MRVLTNNHRHIVLEVERGNRNVVYLELEASLEIRKASLADFDAEYNLFAIKAGGVSEYLPIDFARHYLCQSMDIYTHSDEVVELLVGIMATAGIGTNNPAVVIKVGDADPVVALCQSRGDAIVVGKYMEGDLRLLTSGADMVACMTPLEVAELRRLLDPSAKPSLSRAELGKGFSLTCEGVYKMATAKKVTAKAAPKKAAKVATERVAKNDGPVAKIHAFLTANQSAIKSGAMSRKDANAALEKMGISKGTIGVQVGKWATEAKVAFVKPAAEAKAKVKPAAEPAAKKAKAKPAAKKAAPPAVRKASPSVAA